MISYNPLWHTLLDKGVKKIELCKESVISTATLAKLNKNEYVALTVIEKLCNRLDCKIEQVVEIFPDDK